MKVIIIKDCKDGKVNEIIEVSDGYAKNFLIRNGFANPINSSTTKIREHDVKSKEDAYKEMIKNANIVKSAIESITLEFKLKTTNLVVHGSVTRKQIIQELKRQKIHVDGHSIGHLQINSLGLSIVPIKLNKDVIAKLKVQVIDG